MLYFQEEKTGKISYTDGSKIGNNTRARIFGEHDSIQISDSFQRLPNVYQMELYAIILCLEEIHKEKIENKNIHIISDSESALKSLIEVDRGDLQTCMGLYTKSKFHSYKE